MQELTHCEKCNNYVDYKRHWDLTNNCCDKCNRLQEISEKILPELYEDFANAKSNLTKKFLMDTMFELENERTTLIIKGVEQDEME